MVVKVLNAYLILALTKLLLDLKMIFNRNLAGTFQLQFNSLLLSYESECVNTCEQKVQFIFKVKILHSHLSKWIIITVIIHIN